MSRIAFVGASGTGKSTIAVPLAERLGLPFNTVGSRSTAASMGFASPYDVDKASAAAYGTALQHGAGVQTAAEMALAVGAQDRRSPSCRAMFQRKLQSAKIGWELERTSGFVSDRSTIDDLLYAMMHCTEFASDYSFIDTARMHMWRYEVLVYTPVSEFQSTADDPARVVDVGYHLAFDALASGLLFGWVNRGECSPAILTLRAGTPEERLDRVIHFVEEVRNA